MGISGGHVDIGDKPGGLSRGCSACVLFLKRLKEVRFGIEKVVILLLQLTTTTTTIFITIW
jgi:hypothetical protein